MFAIMWILDCWLPDTFFLETNAVSLPGKLLSVNALKKPYPCIYFLGYMISLKSVRSYEHEN